MLEVHVGGGEYNVAYALARLGLRTAWVGGLNTSPMGKLVLNHGRAVGVDMSHAVTRKYDGYGKKDRIGLNFTEVGHGRRASTTLYDRGHAATAGIKPGEVNWKKLFEEDGVRWLHTGGIFSALSTDTRAVVAEAVKAAHEAGTIVSYDLNFRFQALEKRRGDRHHQAARAVHRLPDRQRGRLRKSAGLPRRRRGRGKNEMDTGAFKAMVERVVKDFPNVKVVGTTLRGVQTALINDWSAILWTEGKFYDGLDMKNLEIADRVGGGDGFASGFTYGLLTGQDPQQCVNLGVAHGAMLMSTRGDTSQIDLEDLMHVAGGGSARIAIKRLIARHTTDERIIMETRNIGIVMNGVTGRMGTNQHLIRSILAIIKQGGVKVNDNLTLMPQPILTGRNENKLKPLAVDIAKREIGRELPYTTNLQQALDDKKNEIFFDASGTLQRAQFVEMAVKAGKSIYCEKPTAVTTSRSAAARRSCAKTRS